MKRYKLNWQRMILVYAGIWLFMYFVMFPLLWFMNNKHQVPVLLNLLVLIAVCYIISGALRDWYSTEVTDEDDDEDGDDHDGAISG